MEAIRKTWGHYNLGGKAIHAYEHLHALENMAYYMGRLVFLFASLLCL